MNELYRIIGKISDAIINPLIFLLFSLAIVVFLWGVVEFLITLDNEEGREIGKKHMIWGIIGMFIMFSVYGIIYLITSTFGIDIPAPFQ